MLKAVQEVDMKIKNNNLSTFGRIFLWAFGWLTGGWYFFRWGDRWMMTLKSKGGGKTPLVQRPDSWQRYIIIRYQAKKGDAAAYPACHPAVWWWPAWLPWWWVCYKKPVQPGETVRFGVGKEVARFGFVGSIRKSNPEAVVVTEYEVTAPPGRNEETLYKDMTTGLCTFSSPHHDHAV